VPAHASLCRPTPPQVQVEVAGAPHRRPPVPPPAAHFFPGAGRPILSRRRPPTSSWHRPPSSSPTLAVQEHVLPRSPSFQEHHFVASTAGAPLVFPSAGVPDSSTVAAECMEEDDRPCSGFRVGFGGARRSLGRQAWPYGASSDQNSSPESWQRRRSRSAARPVLDYLGKIGVRRDELLHLLCRLQLPAGERNPARRRSAMGHISGDLLACEV
jgi:hypothetical protein